MALRLPSPLQLSESDPHGTAGGMKRRDVERENGCRAMGGPMTREKILAIGRRCDLWMRGGGGRMPAFPRSKAVPASPFALSFQ
jgi:hypothetical protein